MTLGPFLRFLCYVLGTKLGAVLPLRMRHKAMQLVLCRLAGYKTEKSLFFFKSGFRSDVRPFFGLLLLRFGTKLGAVADASQSYAACAWQDRWTQK